MNIITVRRTRANLSATGRNAATSHLCPHTYGVYFEQYANCTAIIQTKERKTVSRVTRRQCTFTSGTPHKVAALRSLRQRTVRVLFTSLSLLVVADHADTRVCVFLTIHMHTHTHRASTPMERQVCMNKRAPRRRPAKKNRLNINSNMFIQYGSGGRTCVRAAAVITLHTYKFYTFNGQLISTPGAVETG